MLHCNKLHPATVPSISLVLKTSCSSWTGSLSSLETLQYFYARIFVVISADVPGTKVIVDVDLKSLLLSFTC